MSNIVTSQTWQVLANLPTETLKTTLDILADQTYNYEEGVARYPSIEYCISLAMDRIKNRTVPEEVVEKEVVEEVVDSDDERRNESPKTRRNRIREAWVKKLEKPPEKPKISESVKKRLANRRRKKISQVYEH